MPIIQPVSKQEWMRIDRFREVKGVRGDALVVAKVVANEWELGWSKFDKDDSCCNPEF